jgi:hypothetical protein
MRDVMTVVEVVVVVVVVGYGFGWWGSLQEEKDGGVFWGTVWGGLLGTVLSP